MGLVYPGAAPEAAKEGNASPSLNLAQRSGLRVGDVSAFTDTAPERRALPRAVRAKAKRPRQARERAPRAGLSAPRGGLEGFVSCLQSAICSGFRRDFPRKRM